MTLTPMHHRRHAFALSLLLASAFCAPAGASASDLEGPLATLQTRLTTAGEHAPGRVGIAIEDLATGMTSGFNQTASLPAASTIKIPVMIEVFKQMEAGALDLNTVVHLEDRDRDYGWGDMADAPGGTGRTVKQLLMLMITQSDNTATNMLIRKVGRAHINATMNELGLQSTRVGDYIRSQTDAIRYALRTSPQDMLTLLDAIARDKMIDPWSSREMLAILEGQTHNGLIPMPLPEGLKIAHKTGTLHDTLNDVGIVFRSGEPYVIAVMTTHLPDLDLGRAFIHHISRITYDAFGQVALWREDQGIAAFSDSDTTQDVTGLAPDLKMWDSSPAPAELGPTTTDGD